MKHKKERVKFFHMECIWYNVSELLYCVGLLTILLSYAEITIAEDIPQSNCFHFVSQRTNMIGGKVSQKK